MGEAVIEHRVTPRDVDAEPVAWREAGDGPGAPAAFLHGLGGSRTAWRPQLETLGAHRRCLAWDAPGYGASAPLPSVTFPVLAAAADAWLAAAGARPAHVLGLSMGGMVALHLALTYPGAVRSLVVIDSSPAFGLDGTTTEAAWVDARLAPLRSGATPGEMAPQVLRSIAGPATPAAVIDEAVAAMARIPASALEAYVRCLPTHDVRADLHRIAVPTLVLVGELDRETPPAYGEAIARAIPGARLAVVPGAGHLAPVEQPAAVNRLIADFLQEHD